jgi:ankyrin repeat protein
MKILSFKLVSLGLAVALGGAGVASGVPGKYVELYVLGNAELPGEYATSQEGLLFGTAGGPIKTASRELDSFFFEVGKGTLQAVKKRLAEAPDLVKAVRVRDGVTALMLAASNGHIDVVKALIQEGANINLQDNGGRTALDLALKKNHTAIVDFLLKRVAAADKESLIKAATSGDIERVKVLIAAGADVDFQRVINGFTALIYAAQKGYTHIVEALLRAGANVNAKNKNGHTALMRAAEKDNPAIIEMLLQYGAQGAKESLSSDKVRNVRIREMLKKASDSEEKQLATTVGTTTTRPTTTTTSTTPSEAVELEPGELRQPGAVEPEPGEELRTPSEMDLP